VFYFSRIDFFRFTSPIDACNQTNWVYNAAQILPSFLRKTEGELNENPIRQQISRGCGFVIRLNVRARANGCDHYSKCDAVTCSDADAHAAT
jgi:hypothetical protein